MVFIMLKGLLIATAVVAASVVSMIYARRRAMISYEKTIARINKQYSEDLQTIVNLLSSETTLQFEKLTEEEAEELEKVNAEIRKYDAYSRLS